MRILALNGAADGVLLEGKHNLSRLSASKQPTIFCKRFDRPCATGPQLIIDVTFYVRHASMHAWLGGFPQGCCVALCTAAWLHETVGWGEHATT